MQKYLFLYLPSYRWSLLFSGLIILVMAAYSCADQPATSAVDKESPSDTSAEVERIISLNGSLTELLFDLGYGAQIVGVDVTSTYPEAAAHLPKLGHVSQLNTEALLAMQPSLVVVAKEDAEKASLQQLQAAGLKIVSIDLQPKLDNALVAARALHDQLGFPAEKLATLEQQINDGKETLASIRAETAENDKPRVLFIYARGTGSLMVGGTETTADQMIRLAGGQNAIASFADFEALTPESLLKAAPDVILMFKSGLASLDGVEGLSQIPGMTQVPAYKNERIIAMDGHYLLGFGPRATQAAIDLARQLHPTGKVQ